MKQVIASVFTVALLSTPAFAADPAEEDTTSTELNESTEPTRYDSMYVNSDGSSTFIRPHFFRAGVRYPLYSPYVASGSGWNSARFDPDIERLNGVCRYLGLSEYIEGAEVREPDTIAVQLNADGLFERMRETRRYVSNVQGVIEEITCR